MSGLSEFRIYVGPGDDSIVASAVTAAGARLVDDPSQANCLVWLSPSMPDLKNALHPELEWVQLKSAGIEHVLAAGVVDGSRIWTSARGAYADAVAEHGLTLMLAAARRLHEIVPMRRWGEPGSMFGRVLQGSAVTIVGAGAIGQGLIRYLAPFGVEVTAVTRSGREIEGAYRSLAAPDLDSALPGADFVVLAAPSTSETIGLANRGRFEKMSDGAWLVNIGRGNLVVTDDLVDALESGIIGGAALDVTDPEPLPDDHPLWNAPHVLITPHTSNPPETNSQTLADRVVRNIERLRAGEDPIGIIDTDLGY